MRSRHGVLIGLLVGVAVINYIDRGSLSVAAPAISAEMHLDPERLGVLLSAFFWSYAALQFLSGWLADRFSVVWVMAWGLAIWSAATLATGLIGGLTALLICRVVLGAGESVAFPCYSKAIAGNFSIERRGVPNSLIEAATKLGPALGTLLGGMLLVRHGWRTLFLILGGGSLLWLLPWLVLAPRGSTAKAEDLGERPGILQIAANRDAWGTFLGNACYTYSYYFLLTWLPSYLVQVRHLSMAEMGVWGSIPYFAAAAAATVCGWLSDAWIRRGASPTRVRKTFVASGFLLSTVMVGAPLARDLRTSMALLCVGYVAFGMLASNHWAITQTLAGASAAGTWTGMQNTLGNLSGIVAPIATGIIVKITGSYVWAFVSPAILAVAGACSYVFLVREVAPIKWRR
ncbi:MAG TPA: MFS transporter [Bryobacteraceae bacterium]|jgi:MFS family permease|nr:MFS transporter [Bryobacteraceae bacterium]